MNFSTKHQLQTCKMKILQTDAYRLKFWSCRLLSISRLVFSSTYLHGSVDLGSRQSTSPANTERGDNPANCSKNKI